MPRRGLIRVRLPSLVQRLRVVRLILARSLVRTGGLILARSLIWGRVVMVGAGMWRGFMLVRVCGVAGCHMPVRRLLCRVTACVAIGNGVPLGIAVSVGFPVAVDVGIWLGIGVAWWWSSVGL